MGILNVTPDSFSDGDQFLQPSKAVVRALAMLDEGADILDIGGESTRPDAQPMTAQVEQERVLPVLAAVLSARPSAIVSVDTYHAETARAAIALGAEIINDVSGLLWDSAMAAMLGGSAVGVVLMHTRGRPREWAHLPPLAAGEVTPLVLDGLRATLVRAQAAALPQDTIVLDPGFGFGKQGAENMELHASLEQLATLGYPLLIGTSRKRFLTPRGLDAAPESRLAASTASNTAAILAGAHILRVHDVVAAAAAAHVADSLLTHSVTTLVHTSTWRTHSQDLSRCRAS